MTSRSASIRGFVLVVHGVSPELSVRSFPSLREARGTAPLRRDCSGGWSLEWRGGRTASHVGCAICSRRCTAVATSGRLQPMEWKSGIGGLGGRLFNDRPDAALRQEALPGQLEKNAIVGPARFEDGG